MCWVFLIGPPFFHLDLCPQEADSFIRYLLAPVPSGFFFFLVMFGHWRTPAGYPEVFILLVSCGEVSWSGTGDWGYYSSCSFNACRWVVEQEKEREGPPCQMPQCWRALLGRSLILSRWTSLHDSLLLVPMTAPFLALTGLALLAHGSQLSTHALPLVILLHPHLCK